MVYNTVIRKLIAILLNKANCVLSRVHHINLSKDGTDTPLMSVSSIGDIKIVQCLLKAGALVNLQDLVRLMDEVMVLSSLLHLSCHIITAITMQLYLVD